MIWLSHILSSFFTLLLGQPGDEITVFDYLWVQRTEYNRLLLLSQPSSCFPVTLTSTSGGERILHIRTNKTDGRGKTPLPYPLLIHMDYSQNQGLTLPVLKELDLETDSKTKMYVLLLEQGKIFLDINNLQLLSSHFLNMNKICLSFIL